MGNLAPSFCSWKKIQVGKVLGFSTLYWFLILNNWPVSQGIVGQHFFDEPFLFPFFFAFLSLVILYILVDISLLKWYFIMSCASIKMLELWEFNFFFWILTIRRFFKFGDFSNFVLICKSCPPSVLNEQKNFEGGIKNLRKEKQFLKISRAFLTF